MAIIRDPNGLNAAEVTDKGRLLVLASQEPIRTTAAKNGDSYIAYFLVTYTNAANTGLAYIKNNDTQGRSLIITNYFPFYGSTTGGSGDALLSFYKNPESGGGTIISGALPAIVSNTDFQSSKTVNIDAFVGNGSTSTFGTAIGIPLAVNPNDNRNFETPTILPLGASIGFGWQPPTGNTSQYIAFLISFYMEE